jgi:plasmid stability protein
MAEVKVRKLENWVVQVWQKRAQQAGRSLEEELRQALTAEALRPQQRFAAKSAELRAAIQQDTGLDGR